MQILIVAGIRHHFRKFIGVFNHCFSKEVYRLLCTNALLIEKDLLEIVYTPLTQHYLV